MSHRAGQTAEHTPADELLWTENGMAYHRRSERGDHLTHCGRVAAVVTHGQVGVNGRACLRCFPTGPKRKRLLKRERQSTIFAEVRVTYNEGADVHDTRRALLSAVDQAVAEAAPVSRPPRGR